MDIGLDVDEISRLEIETLSGDFRRTVSKKAVAIYISVRSTDQRCIELISLPSDADFEEIV